MTIDKIDNIKMHSRMLYVMMWIAIMASNFSQLPVIEELGITQLFNAPMWLLIFLYLILSGRSRLYRGSKVIFFGMPLILCGIMIETSITNHSYFNSSMLSCLFMSMFIYYIGAQSSLYLTSEDLYKLMTVYAMTAAIVSVVLYFSFFSSGFDITSRVYAYSSKNSISQILFTSVVILMFSISKNRKLKRALIVCVIAFELFVIMLLKSRATIIGFMLCIIYIVIGKGINKKLKASIVIILSVGIVAILASESLNTIVFDNILFAGRDASNLDDLSSGRLSILETFPGLIEGNWLTGIGSKYFECFPVSAILQFGILVAIPILVISYMPLFDCYKYRREGIVSDIYIVICIGYSFNSLFEGLAPIGPGAKCYFLWLFFGIISTRKKYSLMLSNERGYF